MGGHRDQASRPGGRLARYWWLLAVAALLTAGVAVGWRVEAQREAPGVPALAAASGAPAPARRETRPTLDPGRFVGKARLAHQVAREIPGVIDQLYCYCECDKHIGHKSLLSCYTDGHAAT